MERDFEQFLSDCEELIKSSRAPLAAARLKALNTAKLLREQRLPVANLCRRVGLLEQGLRVLTPIVRGESLARSHAQPNELSEYAVLLQRSGGVGEARKILESIDAATVPEALLYRAFCHFAQWEYSLALPLLKTYLSANIKPYQKIVGQVNLADALISVSAIEEARALLFTTLELAKQKNYGRITGNCLEMLAQLHIISGQFTEARKYLDEAASVLGAAGTLDEFYLRRWKAVLEGLSSGSLEPLQTVKTEAMKRHEESLRSLDFYSLKISFEPERFNHLYFGTPFPEFRRRLENEFKEATPAETFLLGAGRRILNLELGELDGTSLSIAGSKLHVALNAISRDFYKSTPIPAIFSALFPEEHFNIFSSPNRVHQVLRRLRAWLKETKIPASIERRGRGYALQITGEGVALQMSLERSSGDDRELRLTKLRAAFSDSQDFRAEDAKRVLGLSGSSFRRFMTWAESVGAIDRFGSSTATKYFLTKK